MKHPSVVRTCSIRSTSLIPAPPRSGGLANACTHDTNISVDTPPPPPLPLPLAPRAACLAAFVREESSAADANAGFSGKSNTTLTPNTETPHCLSTPVATLAHKGDKSAFPAVPLPSLPSPPPAVEANTEPGGGFEVAGAALSFAPVPRPAATAATGFGEHEVRLSGRAGGAKERRGGSGLGLVHLGRK